MITGILTSRGPGAITACGPPRAILASRARAILASRARAGPGVRGHVDVGSTKRHTLGLEAAAGLGLVSGRQSPGAGDDSVPRHSPAVLRHDRADSPRGAAAEPIPKHLRDRAVRGHPPGRDLLNQVKHRLDVLCGVVRWRVVPAVRDAVGRRDSRHAGRLTAPRSGTRPQPHRTAGENGRRA